MGAQKTHGEVSLLTVMFRQDVLQELTASTVVGSLSCSKIKSKYYLKRRLLPSVRFLHCTSQELRPWIPHGRFAWRSNAEKEERTGTRGQAEAIY